MSVQAFALAGWAFCLMASSVWLHTAVGVGWTELTGGLLSHLLALPVVSRRTSPRLMPVFGCAVLGVCFGLLVVDVAFDLVIIQESSMPVGPSANGVWVTGGDAHAIWHGPKAVAPGRLVAHYYYHTLLNTLHINLVLWWAMLVLVLAATRGLDAARGTAQVRQWRWMVVQCSATNGLYMRFVVPRYLAIRAATQYDEAAFDRWGEVLAVRCVLMSSIAYAACQCMRMTLDPALGAPVTEGGKRE